MLHDIFLKSNKNIIFIYLFLTQVSHSNDKRARYEMQRWRRYYALSVCIINLILNKSWCWMLVCWCA